MTLSNPGAFGAAAAFVVTFASSALALSAHADPAAQSSDVVKHYDLRHALSSGAPPARGVTMDLHLSTAAIDQLEPENWDLDLGPELAIELNDSLQVVRQFIGATKGAELSALTHDGSWLTVTGNAAAHDAALAAIEQIEALMLDSVNVEVILLPRTDALIGAGGWISGQATEALLKGVPELRRAMFPARIGRRTTWDQTLTKSFLYDYGVEVAQGAIVADPVVSILRTGIELGVRIDTACDGSGFLVRTWGRSGEESAPMRNRKIPMFGDTAIELPTVRSTLWASSARLAPGESMVVDAGAKGLMLLRVVPESAQSARPRLSLGAHALRPMRPEVLALPRAEPSGGFRNERSSVEDFEFESLTSSPRPNAVAEALGLEDTSRLGLHFVAPTDSKAAQAATAALKALQQSRPLTEYTIDVRFQVMDSTTALAMRGQDQWDAFASASSTVRLASTTVGHDATLLVDGTEFAYLRDHDTQIAAGAVAPDPIPGTTFEGAAIWCAPMKTASGNLRAWFDIQVQQGLKDTRTIATASYHPAPGSASKDLPRFEGEMRLDQPIELPETESAGGTCLAQMKEGAWSHVMTQPVGRGGRELVVIAKITTR